MSLKQFLCELSDAAYDYDYLNRGQIREMYPMLGSGCTRYVCKITYEDKTYAIKFALSNSYIANNRREARAWRTASKDVRALMAEVYDVSTCGRVLAMEIVPQTLEKVDDREELYDTWTKDLRNAFMREGYSSYEAADKMIDDHYGNIGVRENGDIVWIDYPFV